MAAIKELYPEADSFCGLVNDEAGGLQGLWSAFLAYAAFVVIVVVATTDEILLRALPIDLPLLSVQLNLVGFYIAAPLLLVIFHLYLLVKLILFVRSFNDFEDQLVWDVKLEADCDQIRKHLNNTLFAQSLNPGQERWVRVLCGGLLVITIGLLPLAALLLTIVWFLPYQSETVTWIHRVLIAIDLAALGTAGGIFLWRGWSRIARANLAAAAFAWVLVTALLWLLLTFPGETIDANPMARLLVTPRVLGDIRTTSMHGVFPTTLQLARADIVTQDDDEIETAEATFVLRDRSFRGANFSGADLRKVAFYSADLTGADLSGANLSRTNFGCFTQKIDQEDRTSLIDAAIAGVEPTADRNETGVALARILEADLKGHGCPNLTGVNFSEAVLNGTSFRGALLDQVTFNHITTLEDADFRDAVLLDVAFTSAEIEAGEGNPDFVRGGIFDNAIFIGGNPDFPSSITIQGGSFRHVAFRSIGEAELPRFFESDLSFSTLTGSFAWLYFRGGSRVGYVRLENANVDHLNLSGGASANFYISNSEVKMFRSYDSGGSLFVVCSRIDAMDYGTDPTKQPFPVDWTIGLSHIGKIYIDSSEIGRLLILASDVDDILLNQIRKKTKSTNIDSGVNFIGSTVDRLQTIRASSDYLGLQATEVGHWLDYGTSVDRLYHWALAIKEYRHEGHNPTSEPNFDGAPHFYTGNTEQGDGGGNEDIDGDVLDAYFPRRDCNPNSYEQAKRRIENGPRIPTPLPPALAPLGSD